MMPLQLVIDGVAANAADVYEDLPRAVLISLFSWRRANADDVLPGADKYGWWGDSFPVADNDRIGSRLWLLLRGKLTNQAVIQAKEYADEALQWLIDDGVAESVIVTAERQTIDRLALGVVIMRGDKTKLSIRFADVWGYIDPSSKLATLTPASPPFTTAGSYITDAVGDIVFDTADSALTIFKG